MGILYLGWSVLNLAVLAWFLYISFSVLKWIKDNLGTAALVVFILGSLSFIKGTVTDSKPSTSFEGDMVTGIHTLDEALLYSTVLFYAYPKDLQGNIKGEISQSGLVIGHGWKTHQTTFNFTNNQLHYTVTGTHEWRFLGLNLYPEAKQFKGVAK